MQNEIVEETVAIDNPLAKETTDLDKTNIDIHNIVREISKGDIWNVSQGNGLPTGTEIWSNRPAVIVSNEAINKKAGFVNIVYLTTAEKKPFPNHVPVISGGKQATALCEQIVTVDKSRLTGYISSITEEELTDIERAILFTLGISNSIKPNPIYEKWVNAIERYEMDMRGIYTKYSKMIGSYKEDAALQIIAELNAVQKDVIRKVIAQEKIKKEELGDSTYDRQGRYTKEPFFFEYNPKEGKESANGK